ncbi:MAG TPA: YkgJ family cysteine cluster protein [Spirochaetota bacterium]|mgnify:CR=1 FL=1|nr:YkgJ family cysteine cluster protein [Spirochaetota bacterium]
MEKDKKYLKTLKNIENTDFSCQKCSNCCRIEPGAVFLTEEDVIRIAKNLKLPVLTFLKECCRSLEKDGKFVAALKERANYDCVFWNDGCLIYEDRPLQCKTFPFWPFLIENKKLMEEERKRCKGIGVKGILSFEEKLDYYTKEKNAIYYEYKG